MEPRDYTNDPNIVEAVAFTTWLKEATPSQSGAYTVEEWQRIWRTVDEITKERHREAAQNEMRHSAKASGR